MVLWDTSLPSFWSAAFLNKVAIPCPNELSLHLLIDLLCGKQYELGLPNS